MKKLVITGGKKLSGSINISGSKNAILPILASTILNEDKVFLTNVPIVNDVETMVRLLSILGSDIQINKFKKTIEISNYNKLNTFAPYQLLKTMRAGILVLGPLLAKYRKAKVSLPGGCAIGSRPVDLHLEAFRKMGASFKIKDGYILAEAKKGLIGSLIKFPKISVGATENILIAACFAKGKTIIKNCACEPEIKDLTKFLIKMGCNIRWTAKRTIKVIGVKKLKKVNYAVMFDRIEAGTYIIASALTKGEISLKNINPKIMKAEINIFKKMGVKIITKKNKLTIKQTDKIKKIHLKTAPYPGFPTDLQAQIMVLMCKSNGISSIKEKIFENRFMHVPELNRMGANIVIKGNTANVHGINQLNGAELMATDLRASVSLVLAGLIALNKTIINRVYHLDRGYENLELKLSRCGAIIERIKNGKKRLKFKIDR